MPRNLEKKREKFLTFDDFTKGCNNFPLYFAGKPGEHLIGDAYRRKAIYKKCLSAHPEFAALAEQLYGLNLQPSIGKQPQTALPLKIDKETGANLYRAYLIMRRYVKKDWELFQ